MLMWTKIEFSCYNLKSCIELFLCEWKEEENKWARI
jgi:hypothetical protein